MLVTLTLHDAESLPVWHRNQTTTPAGSSRRLMRTREVMGAALVSMYSVLAAKNSAIPLAEVKRCLHRFALTEFESVMEGSEIPGIRAVTEADLDRFVVRACGTDLALYPLELCVGLTLFLHVFNLQALHIVYVRKKHAAINHCFCVNVEFAIMKSQAKESQEKATSSQSLVRKGMRKMKAIVQALLDASAADVLDCDVLSNAAMERLRRRAFSEGAHGRAVLVQAMPGPLRAFITIAYSCNRFLFSHAVSLVDQELGFHTTDRSGPYARRKPRN